MAFHSVIYSIRPDLVDMDLVRRRGNRENLEEAFSVAETELGIPRLLDPEGTSPPSVSCLSVCLALSFCPFISPL